MYYVYVLRGVTQDRYYIGRTENLQKRISQHKKGEVWTSRRLGVWQLMFYEAFLAKADAIRRERYLKTSKGRSTLNLMLRESLRLVAYPELR